MKRLWQIWTTFGLCLALVVSAMTWLTLKALELDRAEAVARRQAELEEDISRALWRMDARLTPILAQEAARPDVYYRSFLPAAVSGKKGDEAEPRPSPLLVQPSDFILVNFQLGAENQIRSPQCPSNGDVDRALACGVSADRLQASAERLAQLEPALRYDQLLGRLPQQTLPSATGTPEWFATNARRGQPPPTAIFNSFVDVAQLQQGLAGLPPSPAPLDSGSNSSAGAPDNPVVSGRAARSQSRVGNDIQNRASAFQNYAQQSLVEQRVNAPLPPQPTAVREGVSQPLWIGSNLLLARRVNIGESTVIQGCWLDWPRLRDMLVAEVADLLPIVTLEPVSEKGEIRLSRLLATLPVQISVPLPVAAPGLFSPIRVSLGVAWLCLLITATAVAGLLWGVVRLSERRAAFVSAVTHELRTPLTTFRMYSEMLADGMVPDEGQRQTYLNTLRTEADRLAHLVENVLQYARLERGGPGCNRERLTIGELLERTVPRLRDRATEAAMRFDVVADDTARRTMMRSDPTAIEQILFNLVDNACKYAVSAVERRIEIHVEAYCGGVRFRVQDQGPGISAKAARRLFRPFSKSVDEAANSAPGVGLGLALCRRLARDLGGRLELEPAHGAGASFVLTLPADATGVA